MALSWPMSCSPAYLLSPVQRGKGSDRMAWRISGVSQINLPHIVNAIHLKTFPAMMINSLTYFPYLPVGLWRQLPSAIWPLGQRFLFLFPSQGLLKWGPSPYEFPYWWYKESVKQGLMRKRICGTTTREIYVAYLCFKIGIFKPIWYKNLTCLV